MATRFYFHASGSILTASNPGFDANWEQTGQATRLPMDLKTQQGPQTALTNSSNITVPITTTQDILCYQFVSNQIFKPAKLDASTTFSLVFRTLESATTANCFLAYSLRAFDVRGLASLGTISSNFAGGGTEYAAAAQTRIFAATAITATQIDQLFRLVLEIGSHAAAPTAATTYTLRTGDNAASDFALTSGLTTDLNSWFELSTNLNALVVQNAMHVRAPSGISVTEKTR
jgi:hypothetical protein